MPTTIKTLTIQGLESRKDIRNHVIAEFLKEEPGNGTGEESSKYIYEVEILSNNQKVYLQRPARLNKGMDFIVNTDGWVFYSDKPNKNGKFRHLPAPAHHNIISDLKLKKSENPSEYERLFQEIEKIFNIQPYDVTQFNFSQGMPIDMLLAIIKWLFIEQDVTYWNWSGRNMLMNGIREDD